ncbi:MAG: alpha-2-macroglobulin family protein [Candidatus Micrarchaeota archaeon]
MNPRNAALFLFVVFALSAPSYGAVYTQGYRLNMYLDKQEYIPNENIVVNAYIYESWETVEINETIYPYNTIPFILKVYRVEDEKDVFVRGYEKEFEKGYGGGILGSYATINITLPSGEYKLVGETTLPTTKNVTKKITVSEIGLIAKYHYYSSGNEEYVYAIVVNKTSGEPIPGALVSLYERGDWDSGAQEYKVKELLESTFADYSGMAKLKLRANRSSFVLKATYGKESARVDAYSYASREYGTYTAYAYTDRPIYRPTQTVHFRAIIFTGYGEEEYGDYSGNVTLKVYNPEYKIYVEKTVEAKNNIIYADFLIDKDAALGYYNIQMYANGSENWGRWVGSYNFEVQEYQKPEFKVTITPLKGWFGVEEKVSVSVDAQYYFGKPVVDGEVEYKIYKGYQYRPCGGWRCGYYEMDYYGYGGYRSYTYKEKEIVSGTLRTDSNGSAIIEFVAPDFKGDYDVIIEVKVREKSEKTVEETGSTRVSRGFSVYVEPKWYAQVGEETSVKITIKTPDGKPIAGQSGILEISRREYAREGGERNESLKSEMFTTDDNGIAHVKFVPQKSGQHILKATVVRNGVLIEQEAYLWAYGEGRPWYRFEQMELTADKDAYKDGDVMEVYISSPIEDANAYVSLEDGKILSLSAQRINGVFLALKFPITGDLPSAFKVEVIAVRNGTLYSASKIVTVERSINKLLVDLKTNKQKYEPGERAHISLALKDWMGRARAGIISLAVVDESIFALAPDRAPTEVYKYFYQRAFGYRTYTAYSWTYGRYYYPLAHDGGEMAQVAYSGARAEDVIGVPPLGGVMGKGVAGLETIQVRREFPDTAYWNPFLIVGEGGDLVSFEMPDSLTTWNISAVASSDDKSVGMGSAGATVSKDLLVRLETPRFFTQNDEVKISAIIHNYMTTPPYSASGWEYVVYLNVSGGAKLLEEPKKYVHAGTDSETKVEYKILVDGCCQANITANVFFEVSIPSPSDAMQLSIPILPHGMEKIDVLSGAAEDETLDYVVPDATGGASVKLALTASLATSALDGLEYLARYPYGCVEQTASSFIPDVIILKTARELDIKISDKLQQELPDMVEKGLARLYGFQNSDGGWGWWSEGKSDPRMTAYVMYGLGLAKNAGVGIDESAYMRGRGRLLSIMIESDDMDELAHAAYVYSMLEPTSDKLEDALDKIDNKKDSLSDYHFALFVGALQNADDARAGEYLGELIKRGDCTARFCKWEGVDYKFNDVEATSKALSVLARAGKKDEAVKAVAWLMRNRREGGGWYSTRDTALALIGISEYLKISGELKPNYDAVVYLDGNEIRRFHVADPAMEKIEIELPGVGAHTVKITKNGEGVLYYLLTNKYYTSDEPVPGSTSGEMGITRVYSANDLRVGDEIEVTLNVKPYDLEYLVLEDYLPSGFEVVKDSVKYNWPINRHEIRDNRLVFFVNSFSYWYRNEMEKPVKITYNLRAVFPGQYHAMPARIYAMYNPETYASSVEARLNVYSKVKLSALVEEKITTTKVTIRLETDDAAPITGTLRIRMLDESGAVTTKESAVTIEGGSAVGEMEAGVVKPKSVSYEFVAQDFAERGEWVPTPKQVGTTTKPGYPDVLLDVWDLAIWVVAILVAIGALVFLYMKFVGKRGRRRRRGL